MRKFLFLVACVVFGASLTMYIGCSGGSSGGGDSSKNPTILVKGEKLNLNSGLEEIVSFKVPYDGMIKAVMTWPGTQRIRAIFTIYGPGTVLADVTTPNQPLEISAAASSSNRYVLYLGNPDGLGPVDVSYTVTLE